MKTFDEYVALAEQAHGHICAGQILGLRMAIHGLELLGLDDPTGVHRKRLVAYVEIDRCATDAIAARETSKAKAREMYPEIADKNQQQMRAYREMSASDLFEVERVRLNVQPEDLPGYKGQRVVCSQCGEGINFKREVVVEGKTLCRGCAGQSYYDVL